MTRKQIVKILMLSPLYFSMTLRERLNALRIFLSSYPLETREMQS